MCGNALKGTREDNESSCHTLERAMVVRGRVALCFLIPVTLKELITVVYYDGII